MTQTLSQVEPTQIRTLEQERGLLLEHHSKSLEVRKQIARGVWKLKLRHIAAGFNNFRAWLIEGGFAERTATNYVNAGHALESGLDNDSFTELCVMGSRLSNGTPAEEVREEKEKTGKVASVTDFERGYERVPMPIGVSEDLETVRQRIQDAWKWAELPSDGLPVTEAELNHLAFRVVQLIPDKPLQEILRQLEGLGGDESE